ncbi:MAG: hypothetical protein M1821_008476 [Bathelium mastoideum]|nr:MAG: hypothetical protein M1821_008476 [Bathelium mastoideum]
MASDKSMELSNILKKVQAKNLCPSRIWQVASHTRDRWCDLVPSLQNFYAILPDNALQHEDHSACTLDLCEFSARDFTAVQQYHERKPYEGENQAEIARNHTNNGICFPARGLFDDDLLVKAIQQGRLTAWQLDGMAVLEHPRPFMAISHVWSDGTGAGTWGSKQVNECLYTYFKDIAKRFSCEGIWWDTLCVPANRDARTKALQIMDLNYAYAKVTLVHDRFLRKINFTDPDSACFVIVMSAWFTRGWTALELARSQKVKIIFKDSIRDLDHDILRNATPDRLAITLIKNLRYGQVSGIQDLLVTLGPRYTSWTKDKATIAGLLTGIPPPNISKQAEDLDTFQRDRYQQILKKVGKISHGHLFHRSATMSGGFSWCATSLFDLPQSNMEPRLQVHEDGAVVGLWKVYPSDAVSINQCIWGNSHELVEARLRFALQKQSRKHVLLVPPIQEKEAENGQELVWKGLLIQILQTQRYTERRFKGQFAGTLEFKTVVQLNNHSVTKEITIGGDTDGWVELDEDEIAWQIVDSYPFKQTTLAEIGFSELPVSKGKAKAKTVRFEMGCEHSTENENTHQDYRNKLRAGKSEAKLSSLKHPPKVYLDTDCQWTAFHHDVWLGRVTDSTSDTQYWTNADSIGQQAIHLAAERGNHNVVTTILEQCNSGTAILDALDNRGQTPLHRGAWGGFVEIVAMLLETSRGLTKGDIINARDELGNTALHVAASMGFEEVVDCLCAHAGAHVGELIQAKGRYGLTPLHCAAMNGRYEVVKQLVKRGAMINVRDDQFLWTPLHCAADSGHLLMVTFLLEEGANVESMDNIGWTPLHFAAMNGHRPVLNILVEKNADLAKGKDKFGWTPLNFAAINGHGVLLQEFAKHGISAKVEEDLLGWELLRYRISKIVGQVHDTSRKLPRFEGVSRYQSAFRPFEQKAKYENRKRIATGQVRSNESSKGVVGKGESDDQLYLHFLHLIALNGRENVIPQVLQVEKLPSERCFYNATVLHWASVEGLSDTMTLLIQLGGDMDAKDSHGLTPLWKAVEWSQFFMMRLLIEKGAEIEYKIKKDQTLLLFALERKSRGLVKFLLETTNVQANSRDRKGDTPLLHAISGGDEESVELLLRTGRAEPNARNYSGETALFSATKLGYTRIAKRVLETGIVDANISGLQNSTPLHVAAYVGNDSLVELLLGIGHALPDPKNDQLETPLHQAAMHGHHRVVKQLLDTGKVDVNSETKSQERPLDLAAARGHKSIVEQLLQADAIECDYSTKAGSTPLFWAVFYGKEAIVRLLLETRRVDSNRKDHPPLLQAVCMGHEGIFDLLLGLGKATVDVMGRNKETLLCLAAQNGNEAIARKLLAMNPTDADRKDSFSRTPLSYAAEGAHSEIVRLLLRRKVVVDSRDKLGRTPLSYAATSGNIEITRLLLDTGRVKINSVDLEKRAPLHHAACWGREGVVKMLLGVNKIKLDSEDKKGETPLTIAARSGQLGIAKLLLGTGKVKINSKDGGGRTPMYYAAGNQRPDMVRLLLSQKGARIDIVDKYGQTAFHFSVSEGRAETAKLLLDAGEVNLDLADNDGYTPFMCAAGIGNFDLVSLLLETGKVRVDKKAKNGETALIDAARGGYTDIVKLLLSTDKVRTDVTDSRGYTPLAYAAWKGDEGSVKLLLDKDVRQANQESFDGRTPLSNASDNGHDGVVKLLQSIL